MPKLLRGFLRLLGLLTLVSGLGHLVAPARLAAASGWGFAAGWQREIGFWDLAMCLAIVLTLRADDAAGGRRLAIALVVLQLPVALNHAAAALQTQASLNTGMAVVNAACVVFGIAALRAGAKGPAA